jgi:DNA polymerase-3 subunit delta
VPARETSETIAEPAPVYLVLGDDESLVGQMLQDLLQRLCGDRDAATTVEEHGGSPADEVDVGALIDALATPPMLSDRRVVVLRDAGRLLASDASRVVEYLQSPVPGVSLVLAAGGGTVPSALVKFVRSAGGALDTDVSTRRARSAWLQEHLKDAPVRLDAKARGLLEEHLGEDLGRLKGLLDTLASAYGEGAFVDEARLELFLGEAGAVAPWELTDAIADGKPEDALAALGRLLGAAGRHPLAVLAGLHRHYQAMLRLDGSGVTTPEEAASFLGSRSVFPAKKALEEGRRLGGARLGRAVVLLAESDLDLRGRSALPGPAVLEVLVGRLSRLGPVRDGGGRTSGSRPAAGRRAAAARSSR